MAYSNSTLSKAMAVLDERRQQHQAEIRRRQEEARQKAPRIAEIDQLLRSSMAGAAAAIFSQGLNVREEMQKLRAQNTALQQERAALEAEFFTPGYLDEGPMCPHCSDRGYVGSEMCRCLDSLCREIQTEEIREALGTAGEGGESFADFRLSYYSDRIDPRIGFSYRELMERNLNKCRRYAADFGPKSGNLLFVGATGLGKTYLSLCIAKEVASQGKSVIYESAPHLFRKLEKARFTGDAELQKQVSVYTDCDLLVLDDLGTELMSQFVNSALYTLVNDRLWEKKPTVISTNYTFEDFRKRYTEQIASRLYGDYEVLMFAGEDIRRKKKEL